LSNYQIGSSANYLISHYNKKITTFEPMHSTTQTYNHHYSTATIKLAKKELNEVVPQNLLDGNLKIKKTINEKN